MIFNVKGQGHRVKFLGEGIRHTLHYLVMFKTNISFRPAIPNSITEEIRKKIPQAIFTSNPCRIQYCTQEIVIFREDIVTKMCRNCVKFPEDGEVPNHVSYVALNLFFNENIVYCMRQF